MKKYKSVDLTVFKTRLISRMFYIIILLGGARSLNGFLFLSTVKYAALVK